MKKLLLALALLLPLSASAQQYPSNSAITGAGPGVKSFSYVGPCANGQVLGWTSGSIGCSSIAGTGTVTSVGLALPSALFSVSGSPVTVSGTLTGSLTPQSANYVWAGPTSGLSANPTFRPLVGADLPLPNPTTLGGVLSLTPVTSNWVNSISPLSGKPIVSQPTFADIAGSISPTQCVPAVTGVFGCVQGIDQVTSNWINSVVNGVPQLSQPTFNDISGNAGLSQLPSISNNTLLSNISGGTTTPAANGLSAIIDAILGSTQGSIIYRGASLWTVLTPGVQGQVLATSGLSQNPAWITVSGTGTVTSVQAASGLAATAANPITSAGIIGLASISNNDILANISGGSAIPSPNTLTAILDSIFGSTRGNIIFRGGSTWTALGAGTTGQYLQTSGTSANPLWTTATVNVQYFTNSGTYTPTSGMSHAIIECVGPGGGGGGTTPTTTTDMGGGGGGSGSYSRTLVTASQVGASQTVTIGSGGTGGSPGNNNGSAGSSATSVGSLCIANAGGGGTHAATSQVPAGGSAGSVGTGGFTAAGSPGGGGFYNDASSQNIISINNSDGAASYFQGAGLAALDATGGAGNSCGAGGAGGYGHQTATTYGGGNGAAGCVIITEYIGL